MYIPNWKNCEIMRQSNGKGFSGLQQLLPLVSPHLFSIKEALKMKCTMFFKSQTQAVALNSECSQDFLSLPAPRSIKPTFDRTVLGRSGQGRSRSPHHLASAELSSSLASSQLSREGKSWEAKDFPWLAVVRDRKKCSKQSDLGGLLSDLWEVKIQNKRKNKLGC